MTPGPFDIPDDLQDEELVNINKKIDDNIQKHNEELRTRAKPKEQLITSIDCIVQSVKGTIHGTIYTSGPILIGGTTPTYPGGDRTQTEMYITSDTPVITLYFRGWPPLEKGDRIRAYIFKGQQEHEKTRNFEYGPTHYTERDWQETEIALKIEKIKNNDVVAEYHAE